jgi:hypothetical protein
MRFHTAGSERARITSGGDLLVGVTNTFDANDSSNATGQGFQVASSNARPLNVYADNSSVAAFKRSGNDGIVVLFARGGVGAVGSISVTTTATAYNTSSDRRLKENIVDAKDAGATVDAIKVRQFDWKAGGSHQNYGMIAQELMTVAPEAVSGDPESDEMMGVDYSKLVPMLVKEVQSLRKRVAELEAK